MYMLLFHVFCHSYILLRKYYVLRHFCYFSIYLCLTFYPYKTLLHKFILNSNYIRLFHEVFRLSIPQYNYLHFENCQYLNHALSTFSIILHTDLHLAKYGLHSHELLMLAIHLYKSHSLFLSIFHNLALLLNSILHHKPHRFSKYTLLFRELFHI